VNDKREGQGRSGRRGWNRIAGRVEPSTDEPSAAAPAATGDAGPARERVAPAGGATSTNGGRPTTAASAAPSSRATSAPSTPATASSSASTTVGTGSTGTAGTATTAGTAGPGRATARVGRDAAVPPKASVVFGRLQDNVERVLRGKHEPIRLAIACLLAEGHLLIEDKPGTGKTSLARALAASIGGTARRIQFTPDLLPADITGVTVYDPSGAEFRYRPGPVFCNIVVADEINRASPKTQAALLEVMEERQVTADGVSRPVPRPFMVVATQNPLDFHGTYPLPEVQLDRFAMKISLGYTDRTAELEVMAGRGAGDPVARLEPVIADSQLLALIDAVRKVTVGEPLREYVSDVVIRTREHRDLRLGVSTRGTLTLLAVARAYAVSEGRTFVTPDDVKAIVRPTLAHRMAVTPEAELDGVTEADVLEAILDDVAVPRRPS
jgi:MoxR-like ATPase